MTLTWIGHSCFRLEEEGYTIIFDPYEDNKVPGLGPVRENADLVLCSHEHGDHNARQSVSIVTGGKNPWQIMGIDTYHDDKKGTLRGENTIHILDNGSLRLAHFGDIGCQLTEQQAEQLKGLDVALIPVGGYYTVDAPQAKKIMDMVHPRVIIPMHFRGESFGFDVIGPVEAFTDLYQDVIRQKGSVFTMDDKMAGHVVVLEPRNQCR